MDTVYCIISLLAPIAILAVGILWKVSPPPFLAKGLAYRTIITSASEEAWTFAHRHCSKLWIRIGSILTLVTGIVLLAFYEYVQDYFLWLVGGQMALFCVSAFLVDTLLKNRFGESKHQ